MYGSVYNDDINTKSIDYWYEFSRVEECKTCPAYPNCNGVGHCPDAGSICYLTDKPVKINTMRQALLQEYRNYKEKE